MELVARNSLPPVFGPAFFMHHGVDADELHALIKALVKFEGKLLEPEDPDALFIWRVTQRISHDGNNCRAHHCDKAIAR